MKWELIHEERLDMTFIALWQIYLPERGGWLLRLTTNILDSCLVFVPNELKEEKHHHKMSDWIHRFKGEMRYCVSSDCGYYETQREEDISVCPSCGHHKTCHCLLNPDLNAGVLIGYCNGGKENCPCTEVFQ